MALGKRDAAFKRYSTVNCDSLATGANTDVVIGAWVAPKTCFIHSIKGVASGAAGTADPHFDVYDIGGTAAVIDDQAIAAANTLYTATQKTAYASTVPIAAGKIFQIRGTTDNSGADKLDDLCVIIEWQAVDETIGQ